MALPEAERCKGFLVLEKFNFRPPVDHLAYAFKAYELSGGHSQGEAAARYLALVDENVSVLNDFFMLMTSNFQMTSAATLWGDLAYQIGGGPENSGQDWYDRIQAEAANDRSGEFITMINEGLFSYICYDNNPQEGNWAEESGDASVDFFIIILSYII